MGRPYNHDRARRLNLTAYFNSLTVRGFLQSAQNRECLGTSTRHKETLQFPVVGEFTNRERDEPKGMTRLLSFGEGVAYEYTDPAG